MGKMLKRIISITLAASLIFALCVTSFAQNDNNRVSLSIMSSNVAGLPIPTKFSKDGKVVTDDTKMLASLINVSGYDIVCVQEDFQFHSLFAKQMTNYPYKTYTSGGIPAGDGLNVYSKYPIYNVDRVAWEKFNGILDAGNDALTPKGFLKFTADINGVLVDIYDIHIDAFGSVEDQLAKAEQFKQLAKYIDENSTDMPVLITGDYNATFHSDYLAEMYETLIVSEGFEDSWVNLKNNGDYLRGDDAQQMINDWFAQYNNCYWGCWDSVERVLYRGTDTVSANPTYFEYEAYYEPNTTRSLSDHSMMKAVVELSTENYVRPDITLSEPVDMTFTQRLTHAINMVVRCLKLLIPDFLKKLFAGEIIK